mmetsp:Transcript_124351/g.363118  ORF Transcript_124351/g.363118 Transcript_124351/m.363118 type:complete len:495 (+) Transcript_124351:1-1485(+)
MGRDPWGGVAASAGAGRPRAAGGEQQGGQGPAHAASAPADPWATGLDPWGGVAVNAGAGQQRATGGEAQGQALADSQPAEAEAEVEAIAWAGAVGAQRSREASEGAGQQQPWEVSNNTTQQSWDSGDSAGQQQSWEVNGYAAQQSWEVFDNSGQHSWAAGNDSGQQSWEHNDSANWTSWNYEGWNAGAAAAAQPWADGADAASSSSWSKLEGSAWSAGAAAPSALERSFAKDEKARRAALRQQEAERRRAATATSVPAPCAATTPALPSRPPPAAASALLPTSVGEPAEEPSPGCLAEVANLRLAGGGLSDGQLAERREGLRERLARGEVVWPASDLVVDLRDNQITDKGLGDFLAFLCEMRAQPEELLLTGNPLEEPHGLREFLLHECSGLHGRLYRLDFSAGQLSPGCFWGVLEACGRIAPRPPLRLGILEGKLGELSEVLEVAESGDFGFCAHRSGLELGKVANRLTRLGIDADVELVYAVPRDPMALPFQ